MKRLIAAGCAGLLLLAPSLALAQAVAAPKIPLRDFFKNPDKTNFQLSPKAKYIWCQEEPRNMGAFYYIRPRLEELSNHKLRYAGRERSSSPAAGSKAIHTLEQEHLVETAFNS